MVMNLANISGQSVDLINETISVLSGEIHVMSGSMSVDSGLHVMVSGQPMTISGDHVCVESGAFVTTQPGIQVSGTVAISGTISVSISGQPVTISGDHVFVESGAFVTTQSGLFVKNVMIDTAGDEAKIDATSQALKTITDAHHEIHEGVMWHGVYQVSGLADDGTADILIVTGSGKEVHAVFEHSTEGAGWFELWENVNLSGSPGGSGEVIVAQDMNRYVSGSPTTTLYSDPSSVGGNRIDVEYVPGGEGPKAGGGGGRAENEWILTGVSGPINYIARIINIGGAAKDACTAIEFYEKTPGY